VKFTDTLRGLLRRWYIVVPGILIAVAIAIGAWFAIPPGYNRSATQLLIPGANSMPAGANPYLFLGGLAPAADVLVRALGSENVLNDVVEQHPGVEIEISRDTTTAGPLILIDVTASSDADAREVLGLLVERTATVLKDFQEEERIPAANRMSVIPVTVDKQSVLQQRDRLVGTVGAGIVGIVLTLAVAGLVDGLSNQRRRRRESADTDLDDTDTTNETSTTETSTVSEPDALVPAGSTDPARAAEDPSAPLDDSLGVPADDEQASEAPPLRSER
jgi:hypothetical protein